MKAIISLFGFAAVYISAPAALAGNSSQCLNIYHNKINEDREINEKTLVNIYNFSGKFQLHGYKKSISENIGDYFSVPYGDFFYKKFDDHAIMRGHVFKSGQARGAILIDKNECISALAVSYYVNADSTERSILKARRVSTWGYMILINGPRDRDRELFVRKSFEEEAGMGRHDWDVIFRLR
jgi:hypothetical protein